MRDATCSCRARPTFVSSIGPVRRASFSSIGRTSVVVHSNGKKNCVVVVIIIVVDFRDFVHVGCRETLPLCEVVR
jgi:hypothetical protein